MTDFSTNSPHSDPPDDESLLDLARFLRQGVGQEWRAELEATEFETHQQRLRSRTLQQVAKMILHRGDRLTIQTGKMQVSGEVVGCGADYLTLETVGGRVDARLDRIAMVVTKQVSGGIDPKGGAPTWRARLKELELTGEEVELYGSSLGHSRQGRIRAVSTDHVWLVERSRSDIYLPFEEIAVAVTVANHHRPSAGAGG